MSEIEKTKNVFRFGYRRAGFRLSVADIAVIGLCAILTFTLLWVEAIASVAGVFGPLVWLPAVALFHFFLFCNVFRIHRRLELTWAAVFVVNCCIWILLLWPMPFAGALHDGMNPVLMFWLCVLGVQTPVTVVLIVIAIFTEDYHGIGYRLGPWSRRDIA